MASGSGKWDVPEESLRIAHPQKIYLKFSASEASVEEYLVDLSMTGMFVRCSDPPPPGTLFEFKMQLASGEPPAHGEAVVVWVREQQQRLSHPRGMGVRFTKVDQSSRDQIRSTVERYTLASEDPENLQTLRSVVEETLGDVLETESAETSSAEELDLDTAVVDDLSSAFLPPKTQPTKPDPKPDFAADFKVAPPDFTPKEKAVAPAQVVPRRKYIRGAKVEPQLKKPVRVPWGWIGGALLLCAAIATAWAWNEARDGMPRPGQEPSPTAEIAQTEVSQREPAQTGAASPSSPEVQGQEGSIQQEPGLAGEVASEEAPSEEDRPEAVIGEAGTGGAETAEPVPAVAVQEQAPNPEARVLENLNIWATSWANQNVDGYLDSYSSFFRPPRGQRRIAWRRDRRERILRPQRIELEIRNIRSEALSDTRFRVVFEQTYRSETFQDTVTKALEWVLEDGDWKILKEEAS